MSDEEKKINELLEENSRLRVTIEELTILNEIATAVSSVQSLDDIESLIIKKCLKYLAAEEGVIMLLNNSDQDKPFQTIMRTQNSILNSSSYRINDQVMGWILRYKTALTVNNFKEDTRFSVITENKINLNSLLAVPMFIKKRMIGIIVLFNKRGGEFSESDQRFLAICAAQSAQIIENARLYEQEQLLEKLKEEMSLASTIQNSILPKESLRAHGFHITGKTIPANDIGGDFYDYVKTSEKDIAIWLGDVSGKGIPAALMMANIQGFLRSRSAVDEDCKQSAKASNEFLIKNNDVGKYATLFYSLLNTESGQLKFILAGHNNILHYKHSGEIRIYRSSDLPIGIFSGYNFENQSLIIEPGDFVLIYTDGITETENKSEVFFGEERLIDIIKQNSEISSEQLIDTIFNETKLFGDNQPQNDDISLLIIKRDF